MPVPSRRQIQVNAFIRLFWLFCHFAPFGLFSNVFFVFFFVFFGCPAEVYTFSICCCPSLHPFFHQKCMFCLVSSTF